MFKLAIAVGPKLTKLSSTFTHYPDAANAARKLRSQLPSLQIVIVREDA